MTTIIVIAIAVCAGCLVGAGALFIGSRVHITYDHQIFWGSILLAIALGLVTPLILSTSGRLSFVGGLASVVGYFGALLFLTREDRA